VRRHAVHFEEARTVFEEDEALMKAHFDFAAGVKNPSATRLKRSVTIRLDESTVDYIRRPLTEAEGRDRRHQCGLVVEVPAGRIGRHADSARGLTHAERRRPDRLDQPDGRRHERVAQVAVMVAVALKCHGCMLTS